MMITLMLFVALVTIALLAVLPDMKQQVRRDREEELVHRGTAYMRAIQHFYKKQNRYPSRIEELENTNNTRYLRRRYTDPVNRDPATGKERDFKLLHQQDITLNNGPVLGPTAGGLGSAAQGVGGGQGGFGSTQGGFGGNGGFGSAPGGFGSQGGLGGPGGQSSGFGSSGAQNSQTAGSQTTGSDSGASSGNSSSAGSSSGNSDASGSSSSGSASSGTLPGSAASGSSLNGQTFGGGPILGVASLSKEKSIRIFFDKSHYNDWWFIFMPSSTQAGLLTGPVNPNMPTGGNLNGLPPGQIPGMTAGQGQGLGQALGLGQGLGGATNPGQGLTNTPQTPQGTGPTSPQPQQ